METFVHSDTQSPQSSFLVSRGCHVTFVNILINELLDQVEEEPKAQATLEAVTRVER